jgi:hypothetical protein
MNAFVRRSAALAGALLLAAAPLAAKTAKPPLHGQHWMAVTGKPLAATAGAAIFQKGGQRSRRGLRDDRRNGDDVGRASLGR